MLAFYIIIFSFVSIIAVLWVNGIKNMIDNHPNYRGDDLMDDEEK